jgi:tetratricopeptide (TPR) repeat protein
MRVTILVGLLLTPVVASAQFRLPKGEEEVNRASAMIVRGDYAAAEPLLRRAVADAPNDPYAYFNLASVLRATGRDDEAIENYRRAQKLFETKGPRANGPSDISNCLYGIALALEGTGDPQAAADAWNDYIRFAQRFASDQPAVAIARERVETDLRLARTNGPFRASQQATRPHTTR